MRPWISAMTPGMAGSVASGLPSRQPVFSVSSRISGLPPLRRNSAGASRSGATPGRSMDRSSSST